MDTSLYPKSEHPRGGWLQKRLTDDDTGDKIHVLLPPPRDKSTDLQEFITIMQPAFRALATAEHKLSRVENDLLHYIIGTVGLGNLVSLSLSEAAKEMKIPRRHVIAAMSNLQLRGLVETVESKPGYPKVYRLNAQLGWRGHHRQAKKEQEHAKNIAVGIKDYEKNKEAYEKQINLVKNAKARGQLDKAAMATLEIKDNVEREKMLDEILKKQIKAGIEKFRGGMSFDDSVAGIGAWTVDDYGHNYAEDNARDAIVDDQFQIAKNRFVHQQPSMKHALAGIHDKEVRDQVRYKLLDAIDSGEIEF